MWFMGHIMAFLGFLAEREEQAFTSFWEGKKTLGWLRLSVLPSLSPSVTFPLCVSSSLSACLFSAPIPSPFSLALPPFHPLCRPSAFPSCSLKYFTEPCVSIAQSMNVWGLCQCRHCYFFPLFLLCIRGLIPFSHCISTCWSNRAAAVWNFFFLNEVFVTGK